MHRKREKRKSAPRRMNWARVPLPARGAKKEWRGRWEDGRPQGLPAGKDPFSAAPLGRLSSKESTLGRRSISLFSNLRGSRRSHGHGQALDNGKWMIRALRIRGKPCPAVVSPAGLLGLLRRRCCKLARAPTRDKSLAHTVYRNRCPR